MRSKPSAAPPTPTPTQTRTDERKTPQQDKELALDSARTALEAYARVAQDQSDRGAIATMDEYVYRSIKNKLAELER